MPGRRGDRIQKHAINSRGETADPHALGTGATHSPLLARACGVVRTSVERHGAHDDGRASLEQSCRSLLLDDAAERVEHARVVASLLHGQSRVGLHADQRKIGWNSSVGAMVRRDLVNF